MFCFTAKQYMNYISSELHEIYLHRFETSNFNINKIIDSCYLKFPLNYLEQN